MNLFEKIKEMVDVSDEADFVASFFRLWDEDATTVNDGYLGVISFNSSMQLRLFSLEGSLFILEDDVNFLKLAQIHKLIPLGAFMNGDRLVVHCPSMNIWIVTGEGVEECTPENPGGMAIIQSEFNFGNYLIRALHYGSAEFVYEDLD